MRRVAVLAFLAGASLELTIRYLSALNRALTEERPAEPKLRPVSVAELLAGAERVREGER